MIYTFLLADLGTGGAERVSILMARVLKHHGHTVKFVCLCGGEDEISQWIRPEFELEILGARRTLTALPSLKNYLRSHRDTILFSSCEYVSLLTLFACRRLDIPVIVRLPNMPSNHLYHGFTEFKWNVIRWLNKHLLPKAKTIIAQTEAMRQEAIQRYHLAENKVVTINNPVDKEMVLASAEHHDNPFTKGQIQFLAVSNITYSKGIDVLIEAFAQVRRQWSDAHLTILGRTSSDYAKDIISRVSSTDGISFLGFKANPYPYMCHCDVFVLSSRMEGFPNVVLEAMCFNKPIAATTCVPIISQVIKNNVNGYTCQPEDASELASCMTKAARLKNIHNTYNLFDEQRFCKVMECDSQFAI
jgi:N-acetylgalactosamine-N,N'-diacetylbacillosaminyl-diphospho-undecaprenol 4-alpha-N-acetylgalactosaminyltransferase